MAYKWTIKWRRMVYRMHMIDQMTKKDETVADCGLCLWKRNCSARFIILQSAGVNCEAMVFIDNDEVLVHIAYISIRSRTINDVKTSLQDGLQDSLWIRKTSWSVIYQLVTIQ